MKRNDIPENIGDYLKYDETSTTGLRWIKKPADKINIGSEGGCLKPNGYHQTKFKGYPYANHRIIFFIHHNYCPDVLDHIDGNTKNNKINNLREATFSQNSYNRKINKNNKTGVKGVRSWINSFGTEYWCLEINKQNNISFLKSLRKDEYTLEQAKEIIELERAELHGNFTNHG